MGSIPLPALDIKPPQQQASPLEQYGQLLQLRNAMNNGPLQTQALQQQVQAGGLDVQQKQIQLKDQQAMTQAMQQWGQPKPGSSQGSTQGAATGTTRGQSSMPDYDDLIDLAKKNGASFQAIQNLQNTVLGMKEKASTIVKNDAQAGTANANALKTKNGMLIDAMTGVMNLPDNQLAPGLLSAAQDLAQKGILDPQHVQQAQQLAQSGDPAAIRNALNVQITGMGGFNKLLEDAQKKTDLSQKQGRSDPSSIFYDPSAQSVAMGTAPGAPQIQQGEVKLAARKAGAEESARMPGEMALAAQRQALSQGDPNSAGQLLVNGDATLSELKARGATPDFIAKTLFAANKLSGGKYNAQSADAQFQVAKSPENVRFFGSAGSLIAPGGTLDQLQKVAKDLPANQIPVFNSIADWEKAATGNGPLAHYASTALGVADDYAKVMGGGQGSDTSRLQALNLINKNASPQARAGAVQGIRDAVQSQATTRIGSNPVLKRMYGDTVQPSAATPAPSGLGVRLADAMALPQNKGKTQQQVIQDIQAHGHQVVQ